MSVVPVTRQRVRRSRGEQGAATVALPLLVWVVTLVTIVTIDLGAYLTAASRAQTLADGAALAAVAAGVAGYRGPGPEPEAAAVVAAGGGELRACRCEPGSAHATVTVGVPVPGIVLPTLNASWIEADASAMLAPPAELPPGPTPARARWPRPPEP